MSGSGVATTVTLGSVTWPLLRKAGYPKDEGGGVLAAAGIGAILSPPTLGAAAFIIAEFLEESYLNVLVYAIVPTLLYYLGVLLAIEADARRFGVKGSSWRRPGSGSCSAAPATTSCRCSRSSRCWRSATRRSARCSTRPCWRSCSRSWTARPDDAAEGVWARSSTARAACCRSRRRRAAAGLIVAVVSLTGLGLKLSSLIVDAAGGSLALTALFSAIAVLILGLAVPVTASFIIAAVIIAPAFILLEVEPFVAYMFIFYYAVLSEVSPPTALSAFAAAAITGGDGFRTMMLQFRYTAPAFLVPFAFVLTPDGEGLLLQGGAGDDRCRGAWSRRWRWARWRSRSAAGCAGRCRVPVRALFARGARCCCSTWSRSRSRSGSGCVALAAARQLRRARRAARARVGLCGQCAARSPRPRSATRSTPPLIALTAAGCETPRLDAELLLAAAMGVDRAVIVADPGRAIEPDAARRFQDYAARRREREPVAYILGSKGFRSIELAVDPRVLIPRPETEHLVEACSTCRSGARVCDVGTGSGAIALALASPSAPTSRWSATDASADALDVARANAARLGLDGRARRGRPARGRHGPLDAVVSNPPYVEDGAGAGARDRALRAGAALRAGPDGLDVIRRLVPAVGATARRGSSRSRSGRGRPGRSRRCCATRGSPVETVPRPRRASSGCVVGRRT